MSKLPKSSKLITNLESVDYWLVSYGNDLMGLKCSLLNHGSFPNDVENSNCYYDKLAATPIRIDVTLS